MALITISGYPCSGKTTRAAQIKHLLLDFLKDPTYDGPVSKVEVLSDDHLNLDRTIYDQSQSEKAARGVLFAAIRRLLALDTILIVDAMNYIKGFRYQMYCAAREMRLRFCTLYVVATSELCRERNNSRLGGQKYTAETLENLLVRYEEPSSMARWDSPLFTALWTEKDPPVHQIWVAVTIGNVKPPNSGTLAATRPPTDALHILEQTTATIVSTVLAEQTGMGGWLDLPLSASLKSGITLPSRVITLSELQRLKRHFVTIHKKAITLGTTEKGAVDWGGESITTKFVTYLEENLIS